MYEYSYYNTRLYSLYVELATLLPCMRFGYEYNDVFTAIRCTERDTERPRQPPRPTDRPRVHDPPRKFVRSFAGPRRDRYNTYNSL